MRERKRREVRDSRQTQPPRVQFGGETVHPIPAEGCGRRVPRTPRRKAFPPIDSEDSHVQAVLGAVNRRRKIRASQQVKQMKR